MRAWELQKGNHYFQEFQHRPLELFRGSWVFQEESHNSSDFTQEFLNCVSAG